MIFIYLNYLGAVQDFGGVRLYILYVCTMYVVHRSDESEPSWLKPELELKDFQLGSARLVTFFPSARNRKSAENELKFSFFSFLFKKYIIIFFYIIKK